MLVNKYSSTFQFHYGTIKAWTEVAEERRPVAFQFHYGTIKAQLPAPSLYLRSPDFNSTTVRLKQRTHTQRHPAGSTFQFHYGTIKAAPSLKAPIA